MPLISILFVSIFSANFPYKVSFISLYAATSPFNAFNIMANSILSSNVTLISFPLVGSLTLVLASIHCLNNLDLFLVHFVFPFGFLISPLTGGFIF